MKYAYISNEDTEDFEQEKKIQEWLSSIANESRKIEFDFKHITSKGTARNTRVRASISLDQKISEDSEGTFADIIAGCDGRDTIDRIYTPEILEETDPEKAALEIYSAMGFNEEESIWLARNSQLLIMMVKRL